jgi:hypothetical protein
MEWKRKRQKKRNAGNTVDEARSARWVHQPNHTRTPTVIQSQTHRADARVHELGIRGPAMGSRLRALVGRLPPHTRPVVSSPDDGAVSTTIPLCPALGLSRRRRAPRRDGGERMDLGEQNAGSALSERRIGDLCTTRHPISAAEVRGVGSI